MTETYGQRHARFVMNAETATNQKEKSYWIERALKAYDAAELMGWDSPWPHESEAA